MRSLAFVALLSLVAAPAFASDNASTGAEKPAKAKKICRVNDADTGTRLGRGKICRTVDEWDAIDARNRDSVKGATGSKSR